MILPIYVYGQPVLRQVAEDITVDYPNLKELIENMFETMDHADGVGLAAPQIGLPIRVVVINLDVLSEDYPEYKDFRKAYINAHIDVVEGEEVSMEEGCLSLPGIHESVKRGSKIHVRYMGPFSLSYLRFQMTSDHMSCFLNSSILVFSSMTTTSIPHILPRSTICCTEILEETTV